MKVAKRFSILIVFSVLFLAARAFPPEVSAQTLPNDDEVYMPLPAPSIEIRHAAEAEYIGDERKIVLTGSVHIVRATMSIKSDRIDIQLNSGETEVVTATATGRVVIVDGTRRGTANNAHYIRESSEIFLTGSPKLHDGLNEIAAEKIVYSLADRSMKATGAVRGILIPSSRGDTRRR